MKKQFTIIALASVLAASFSANAITNNITVTANVDPTVAITLADGNPLPKKIVMNYNPATGLAHVTTPVKFWSNSEKADLTVKLEAPAALTNQNIADDSIPLTVSLDGNALTTSFTTLQFDNLFPSEGDVSTGSVTMPLVISQTDTSQTVKAGKYQGTVSLTVTEATAPAI